MEIRPLESWEEYRACERLQREVWGAEFRELAPASLLKVARRLGGVVFGAFPGDGEEMAGFVFGLTGLEAGRPVHWSHMLAVREGHRSRGLGRRLKEQQRALLLDRGVETVYWTFDPLVAANAHFNLNRLGVRVVEYVPRMYGESGSDLHRGLGTDRFVVTWDLPSYRPAPESSGAPEPEEERPEAVADPSAVPAAGAPPDAEPRAPGPSPAGEAPPVVRVDVPADILAVRRRDPEEAWAWRERTRGAFLSRLGSGYRVAGFVPGSERGRYLLARADLVEAADDDA